MHKDQPPAPSTPPPDPCSDRFQAALDRFRESGRKRTQAHVLEDTQGSLFASTISKRRKGQLLVEEVRATQIALDEAKRHLFGERQPVSYQHGYIPVPLDILVVTDLSNLAKLVFMVLLRYAFNKKGISWPSQKTIAGEVGRSERQVQRAILELADHGYIFVSIRAVHGVRTFNAYTLNIQDIAEIRKDARPA